MSDAAQRLLVFRPRSAVSHRGPHRQPGHLARRLYGGSWTQPEALRRRPSRRVRVRPPVCRSGWLSSHSNTMSLTLVVWQCDQGIAWWGTRGRSGRGGKPGGLADPAGLDSFGPSFVGFQGPFGVAALHDPVAQAEHVAGEVADAQPPADHPRQGLCTTRSPGAQQKVLGLARTAPLGPGPRQGPDSLPGARTAAVLSWPCWHLPEHTHGAQGRPKIAVPHPRGPAGLIQHGDLGRAGSVIGVPPANGAAGRCRHGDLGRAGSVIGVPPANGAAGRRQHADVAHVHGSPGVPRRHVRGRPVQGRRPRAHPRLR